MKLGQNETAYQAEALELLWLTMMLRNRAFRTRPRHLQRSEDTPGTKAVPVCEVLHALKSTLRIQPGDGAKGVTTAQKSAGAQQGF